MEEDVEANLDDSLSALSPQPTESIIYSKKAPRVRVMYIHTLKTRVPQMQKQSTKIVNCGHVATVDLK